MGRKVLVADDDRALTHLLSTYLIEQGYDVSVAHDGDEALRKLEQEHPDLVVLDIVMPKVNGYSLLFAMRKIEGVIKTPVIVITSKPEMADIFMVEGVREYMIKPVSPKDLADNIRKHLAGGGL